MAQKFLTIEEAASKLGVTPGRLNEMRGRNQIRGFRDGTTWKFRVEEVDKVLAELKANPPKDDDAVSLSSEEPDEPAGGSVLLSERELGSGPTTSSTIIGKSVSGSQASSESDIKLSDSDVQESSAKAGSDVKLAGGSGVLGQTGSSDLGLQFEELDSLELDFQDSGKGSAAPGQPGAVSELAESGLSLGEDEESAEDQKPTSDIGGSALDLSGDDDLVLGGTGSDVTGNPGDSGISLMDPSDSGLSLDEPLDLGGSAIEGGSLVLGDDGMITLSEEADASAATQLRPEDDFQVTAAAGFGDDDSESGSQVIALVGLEGLDEEAPTQVAGLGGAMPGLEPMGDESATMVGGPGMGPGVMPSGQPMGAAMMAPVVPEAPYSIWNVLSLFVCVSLLCMIGMIMFDMMRNMWSWDKPYPINSSLMDSIISMFKK